MISSSYSSTSDSVNKPQTAKPKTARKMRKGTLQTPIT
jgi:hypothetical protein